MAEKKVVMRIRAIAKCKIKGKEYMPGIFIEGLSDKEIKAGLDKGYLAEVPSVKAKKKGGSEWLRAEL